MTALQEIREEQARADREAREWQAAVAAKAGELGEPLAAARDLERRHCGNLSFLTAVALKVAFERHGWTRDLLHARSENYDQASGPLSTGSSSACEYRKQGHPEAVR
ncbi:MAG: hypothetical protein ACRD0H_24055, partial [Actinomycetes bacterium]